MNVGRCRMDAGWHGHWVGCGGANECAGVVVGPGCSQRGSDVGVTGLEGEVVGVRDEGEMLVGWASPFTVTVSVSGWHHCPPPAADAMQVEWRRQVGVQVEDGTSEWVDPWWHRVECGLVDDRIPGLVLKDVGIGWVRMLVEGAGGSVGGDQSHTV